MSEFTLSAALQAWRFRKWYFIIPALVMPLAAVILAYKLPAIYESKATILIEEQQIPQEFVRSTVTGYADQHVQVLTQQILSRTKLWEIVEKFNLYAKERQKQTKEEILEQMRKDIRFETISAEVQDKKKGRGGAGQNFTIAFSIAYQGENPGLVQKVAGMLSSLYLEQNLKFREEQAETTTRFLEAELKDLKEKIASLGGQISAYKEKYSGTLPELAQFNQAQAVQLENDLRRLDSEIQTAQTQKIYLEGLMGAGQGNKAEGEGKGTKDPRARLRAVNEALTEFRAKFSGDHPDIQRLAKEKAQLEQHLTLRKGGDLQSQQKLAQLQADLAVAQGRFSENHPDVRKLKNEIAQLTAEAQKGNPSLDNVDLANPAQLALLTQVQQLNNQINSLTQLKQKQQEKLTVFRQRLEETPKIEQGYFALQRDYQNAQEKYREVMNKLMEARISEGMEQHQKGERFTIIDPANLPETPVKPKKKMIALAGLFLGLGGGLGLMLARENTDPSIKTAEELAGFIKGLPLGIIATITTAYDLARQRRQRLLVWATAGFSLVLVLVLVHFFYMDLYILIVRLGKFVDKIS